jgi:hypothetical protein
VKEKISIRTLLVCVLVALLAFTMTPKDFIHELLADHRDDAPCSHKTACLHQQKKNCNFHNWVISAPFVPTQKIACTGADCFPASQLSYFSENIVSVLFSSGDSRAPPRV